MIRVLQISQRAHYGLLALLELTIRGEAGPVPASEIAEARSIPPRFLAGILHDLRVAGLVQSARGSRGGYHLVRDPGQVTFGQVLEALTGRTEREGGGAEAESEGCMRPGRCAVGEVLARAAQAAAGVLHAVTLRELAERERALALAGAPDFTI